MNSGKNNPHKKPLNSAALGKPFSHLYIAMLCEFSILFFLALPVAR